MTPLKRYGPADSKPGNYYVTARRDDGRHALLAGPFRDNHTAAIEAVAAVVRIANEVDPRAPWYSYGTCRTNHQHDRPGILNDRLNNPARKEA